MVDVATADAEGLCEQRHASTAEAKVTARQLEANGWRVHWYPPIWHPDGLVTVARVYHPSTHESPTRPAGGSRRAHIPALARRIVMADAHPPEKGRWIVGEERRVLAKELAKRYAEGESIRALVKSTGRSYCFVRNVLNESGAEMRKRGNSGQRQRS